MSLENPSRTTISMKQATDIAYKIMQKVRMEAEAGNIEAQRMIKEALAN